MSELGQRDPNLARRIRAAVNAYAANGHGDVKKLQGAGEYRLRVGTWRVRFRFDRGAHAIVVVRAGPRSTAYRD
jgi:mRNA interferase RelE/StbE